MMIEWYKKEFDINISTISFPDSFIESITVNIGEDFSYSFTKRWEDRFVENIYYVEQAILKCEEINKYYSKAPRPTSVW